MVQDSCPSSMNYCSMTGGVHMPKNPPKSRLGLLMDALNISGKDLAIALHIDDSLVSKWKNNHRPLTLGTPYLRAIAQFLLETEKSRGSNVIDVLLTPLSSAETLVGEQASVSYLCQWFPYH